MSAILGFSVLNGAHGDQPLAYVLEVDEFRILLDCGWSESFDLRDIERLRSYAHHVDAVLISHADLAHCGALPYAYAKLGLRCQIFATTAVYRMGQLFLNDAHEAHSMQEDFTLFSKKDIEDAFNAITQVRYSQTIRLTGKGQGISVTALAAGHMVGGTIWQITKETDEIVYAVDYNHGKERVLDGTVLASLSRPTLLITDALNALQAPIKLKDRDQTLVAYLTRALRGDGNVLILSDTAGRVLEMLQMLSKTWENTKNGLLTYNLVFLSSFADQVLNHAKTNLDVMSEELQRDFERTRTNPFEMPRVIRCSSLQQFDQIPSPKVVVTGLSGLVAGFGLELFIRWAADPKNLILFTGKPAVGTIGRSLLDTPGQRSLTITRRLRVPLQGEELEEHKRQQRRRKEEELVEKEKADEESDSEEEMETVVRHDIMDTSTSKKKTNFFKQSNTFMYRYIDEKPPLCDEYGEVINHADFKRMAFTLPSASEKPQPPPPPPQAVEEEEKTPTKCIETLQMLELNSRIAYIDFEGRSDGASMKKILSTYVKPRQLIVVHGSTEATEDFVDYCAADDEMKLESVRSPRVGERVDVTLEENIFQVKLKDDLVSSLAFQRKDDHEFAWLAGVISADGANQGYYTLEPSSAAAAQAHAPIFAGELRLTEFKMVARRNGIDAEIIGGTLVCDDGDAQVAVRKTGDNITLEGGVSDLYYLVRDLLYQQFAIV